MRYDYMIGENFYKYFMAFILLIRSWGKILEQPALLLDMKLQSVKHLLKFIYSDKATKFCEISTVDLTITT